MSGMRKSFIEIILLFFKWKELAMHAPKSNIQQVLEIMAKLRAPEGCPWDQEQNHESLRFHAVEEVYELIDAIEADDDQEMLEELGDVLLQVVFHCQLAAERKVFDFDAVCQALCDKLIRRHPHVFGDSKVTDVEGVWNQWESIKLAEKKGTQLERNSALDGIPKHLPALHYAEKLAKKARKAKLMETATLQAPLSIPSTPKALGQALLELSMHAQAKGWSAEAMLRKATQEKERELRANETQRS
jgi:XTP/dITP diphosphohydrolase